MRWNEKMMNMTSTDQFFISFWFKQKEQSEN